MSSSDQSERITSSMTDELNQQKNDFINWLRTGNGPQNENQDGGDKKKKSEAEKATIDLLKNKVTDFTKSKTINSKIIQSFLKKKGLKGIVKDLFEKEFTIVDFITMSMSLKKSGSDGSLIELPVIGGLADMLVNEAVEESDNQIIGIALSRGYVNFARVMNSSVGRRSGLVGVYVTTDVMQSILINGGLDPARHNGRGSYNGIYPDHPRTPTGNSYNFFIAFPGSNRGVVKSFIALPIN